MAKKLYFEFQDSEICYSERYFQFNMKNYGIKEIEVFEAIPEIIGKGIFWCNEHSFCGENSKETCGKQCDEYKPRNNINGRCIHHNIWLYSHGQKIILKLKK